MSYIEHAPCTCVLQPACYILSFSMTYFILQHVILYAPTCHTSSCSLSLFLLRIIMCIYMYKAPHARTCLQNLRDSIAESRKRKVEHCTFPGFRVGELTELPTQIEAPHILHRVTKAQDFNVGGCSLQVHSVVCLCTDGFVYVILGVIDVCTVCRKDSESFGRRFSCRKRQLP